MVTKKQSDGSNDIIRTRTYRSVTILNNDKDLKNYLLETFREIAKSYGKEITDFSITDIKRSIDLIYNLLKKLNLHEKKLSEVLKMGNRLSVASDLGNIISFTEAVASITYGNFGWLVWHISKNLAVPRIKRATAVYLVGSIANSLYGGEAEEIIIRSRAFDPILESLEKENLLLIAKTMSIGKLENKSNQEIILEISRYFEKEGKDQSLLKSWFPKNAASYLDVLIVVAKKRNIEIKGLEDVESIEAAICSSIFSEIWEKLSIEEKEKLSKEMKKEKNSIPGEYIFSASSLGVIGLAQLSGFGVYTAASTSLAFLSGAMGFTLPFGAYTGMSSIIATTIGPAGVVFLVPAFFEFLRAKPERTLLGAIIVISVIRSKLIAEGKKYQQVIQKRSFKIYLFYFLALIIGLLVGFILGHYGFSQMLRIK